MELPGYTCQFLPSSAIKPSGGWNNGGNWDYGGKFSHNVSGKYSSGYYIYISQRHMTKVITWSGNSAAVKNTGSKIWKLNFNSWVNLNKASIAFNIVATNTNKAPKSCLLYCLK